MKREVVAAVFWIGATAGFVVLLRGYSAPLLPAIVIGILAGSGVNVIVRLVFKLSSLG